MKDILERLRSASDAGKVSKGKEFSEMVIKKCERYASNGYYSVFIKEEEDVPMEVITDMTKSMIDAGFEIKPTTGGFYINWGNNG